MSTFEWFSIQHTGIVSTNTSTEWKCCETRYIGKHSKRTSFIPSYFVQSKAPKRSFERYLILQVQKAWVFQNFKSTPIIFAILGIPFWAPKSKKCHHHKLQKKLKVFSFYHLCSKYVRFDLQKFGMKCYKIPYYAFISFSK